MSCKNTALPCSVYKLFAKVSKSECSKLGGEAVLRTLHRRDAAPGRFSVAGLTNGKFLIDPVRDDEAQRFSFVAGINPDRAFLLVQIERRCTGRDGRIVGVDGDVVSALRKCQLRSAAGVDLQLPSLGPGEAQGKRACGQVLHFDC